MLGLHQFWIKANFCAVFLYSFNWIRWGSPRRLQITPLEEARCGSSEAKSGPMCVTKWAVLQP